MWLKKLLPIEYMCYLLAKKDEYLKLNGRAKLKLALRKRLFKLFVLLYATDETAITRAIQF
jgi:hypothetical protein